LAVIDLDTLVGIKRIGSFLENPHAANLGRGYAGLSLPHSSKLPQEKKGQHDAGDAEQVFHFTSR
jgi:hypothetical protein